MASRTHYSKPYLSQLENGTRAVLPAHVIAYSRCLDVAVAALCGPHHDPLRVAHEWLVADTPGSVHRAAGRRIGESLVAELEQRVVRLRHLDDTVSGGDLLPLARRELADVEDVVHAATYTEATGRRLLVVVGELSQLVGWIAGDAGNYVQAQNIYLSGVAAAETAGDRTLAAQLLSTLSYQMATVGNPTDAALLAKTAVRGAPEASPVAKALLLERVAWASARSRDPQATHRALDAVDDAYAARSASVEEPHWVYWMSRGEIDVMAGRCLIELGDPARAAPLLTAAIADYDTTFAREVALYRTWLAESFARTGEVDQARTMIEKARAAADGLHSARLGRRVEEIDDLIRQCSTRGPATAPPG